MVKNINAQRDFGGWLDDMILNDRFPKFFKDFDKLMRDFHFKKSEESYLMSDLLYSTPDNYKIGLFILKFRNKKFREKMKVLVWFRKVTEK